MQETNRWERDRDREHGMGSLAALAEYFAEALERIHHTTERIYVRMSALSDEVTTLTGTVQSLQTDVSASVTDLQASIAALKAQIAALGTPVDTTDVDNAVAALTALNTKLQAVDTTAVQGDPKSPVNNLPPAPTPTPAPATPVTAPESPTDTTPPVVAPTA